MVTVTTIAHPIDWTYWSFIVAIIQGIIVIGIMIHQSKAFNKQGKLMEEQKELMKQQKELLEDHKVILQEQKARLGNIMATAFIR